VVSDLEIRLEVIVARPDIVEVVVKDSDAAGPPSRAVTVQYVNHVDGAVDVTEVFTHAPTDAHASIARMLNKQHLADTAAHPEVLRLTVRMIERRRRPQLPVYTVPQTKHHENTTLQCLLKRSV